MNSDIDLNLLSTCVTLDVMSTLPCSSSDVVMGIGQHTIICTLHYWDVLCSWESQFLVCNPRLGVVRVVPVSGRYHVTAWQTIVTALPRPASVRDSNTWPWHRPRTRRMHHWPHTRLTADTADQLVEFVLLFFLYASYKIGEITHFTFFSNHFSSFLDS